MLRKSITVWFFQWNVLGSVIGDVQVIWALLTLLHRSFRRWDVRQPLAIEEMPTVTPVGAACTKELATV